MFNFSLHPYARWLGDGSLDDVPGFNVGESEVPRAMGLRSAECLQRRRCHNIRAGRERWGQPCVSRTL